MNGVKIKPAATINDINSVVTSRYQAKLIAFTDNPQFNSAKDWGDGTPEEIEYFQRLQNVKNIYLLWDSYLIRRYLQELTRASEFTIINPSQLVQNDMVSNINWLVENKKFDWLYNNCDDGDVKEVFSPHSDLLHILSEHFNVEDIIFPGWLTPFWAHGSLNA